MRLTPLCTRHLHSAYPAVLAALLFLGLAPLHAAEPWQRVDTDLGPVYYLDADDFQQPPGVKLLKRKKAPAVLQFDGDPSPTVTVEFSLPQGGRHALVVCHEGMPHSRVTLNARSYKLSALPSSGKGAASVYLDTYDFMETINEVSIVGSRGTLVRGMLLSQPLVRMRDLAVHRAALESQRQTLLWMLASKLRISQTAKKGIPQGLLRALETLRGQLHQDLEGWDKGYAGICHVYDEVETTRKPKSMAGAYNLLLKKLQTVESGLEWIRTQFARGEVLNPAAFRLAPGMPDPDTFRHYPWMAIRAPFLSAGKGCLDRFRLLAIDAFVLQHDTWPEPRMAELLTPERFYCILKHDTRFGLNSSDGGSMWSDNYALSFETYLQDETLDYAETGNILAIAYWAQAGRDADVKDSLGQSGAWSHFLQTHGSSTGTGIPTRGAPVSTQLEYRKFLEERLTDHFRLFNQLMAQNLPRTPRLGLFTPAPPGPTAPGTALGLNPYRLLLDTGFPAVGIATSGDLRELAWAASLRRYDPHRRPWWETGYRLQPDGDRPDPLRLRTNLWRMVQWGIANFEFDAGPLGEGLYQGSPNEGLLRPEWHELALLKRAFVSLSRKFQESHIVSEQVRLLEPGMPQRPDLVVKAAEAWQNWLVARRFPPLWIPREVLEQHDTPASFTGCRMLLAPGALILSETTGQALQKWVREGGIFVTTDPVGHYTPKGEPNRWLQQILGVPLQMESSGLVHIPHEVRPASGVEILRTDDQARPSIVLARWEKGYVLVGLGDVVHTPTWQAVLDRLAQFSLPMHDMRTNVGPEKVELLLRESDDGHRFLAALNPSHSEPVHALVEVLGEYQNVRNVAGYGEAPVETSTGSGVTYVTLDLEPAEAAIYDLGLNHSKLTREETRQALERLRKPAPRPPQVTPVVPPPPTNTAPVLQELSPQGLQPTREPNPAR